MNKKQIEEAAKRFYQLPNDDFSRLIGEYGFQANDRFLGFIAGAEYQNKKIEELEDKNKKLLKQIELDDLKWKEISDLIVQRDARIAKLEAELEAYRFNSLKEKTENEKNNTGD